MSAQKSTARKLKQPAGARSRRKSRRWKRSRSEVEKLMVEHISSQIDPNRLYSRDEVTGLLEIPRYKVDLLYDPFDGKIKVPTSRGEDGKVALLGSDLIKYVRESMRTKTKNLMSIFSLHVQHPSLDLYKEAIERTDPTRTYTPNQAAELLSVDVKYLYGLLSPSSGKPKFQSSTTGTSPHGRRRFIQGSEVIKIAYAFSEMPKEKLKLREAADLLLMENRSSIVNCLVKKGDKTWFYYLSKQNPREAWFIPVYQGLDEYYYISKEHFIKIKENVWQDKSQYSTAVLAKLLKRGRKYLFRDSHYVEKGGRKYFVAYTLTSIAEIPSMRPYPGEVLFDGQAVDSLKRLLNEENEKYITLSDLAREIGIKPANFTTFIGKHAKERASETSRRISIYLDGREIELTQYTGYLYTNGSRVTYFTREQANKLKKYFKLRNIRKIGVALRSELEKTFRNLSTEFLEDFLKTVSWQGSEGTVSYLPGVRIYNVQGVFYVLKDDFEILKSYFPIRYGSDRQKKTALHKLEKPFEGKTFKEIERDPKLEKPFALIRLSLKEGYTDPSMFNCFRSLDEELATFLRVRNHIVNGDIWITNYRVILPYRIISENVLLTLNDFDALSLYRVCCLTNNKRSIFPTFQKLMKDLKSGDMTRRNALILFVLRDYLAEIEPGEQTDLTRRMSTAFEKPSFEHLIKLSHAFVDLR